MSLALEEVCRKLRLAYVPKVAQEVNSIEGTAFLLNVLETELARRHSAKLQRLLLRAGFPQVKTLDGYSFETLTFPASCNQQKLLSLDFIRQKENVLMLGAVGTGNYRKYLVMERFSEVA
jgi:DNA replication protein DnaC